MVWDIVSVSAFVVWLFSMFVSLVTAVILITIACVEFSHLCWSAKHTNASAIRHATWDATTAATIAWLSTHHARDDRRDVQRNLKMWARDGRRDGLKNRRDVARRRAGNSVGVFYGTI